MRAYLINLWDGLRASFWFVPALFALGALLLAWLLPWVDQEHSAELPGWIRTTTGSARITLSTLAGAMLATTGTVFSITIVALSLASQQFGPRLLRRFMYDLPTQLTLGVFLGTGSYALLILRLVQEHEDTAVTLPLSVLAAMSLAMLSFGFLIFFIHHVAILIQAPHVVATVAGELDDALERLFPEDVGAAGDEQSGDERTTEAGAEGLDVHARKEGYIQAVSADGLLELARKEDFVVRLDVRPGDFLTRGDRLAVISPAPSGDDAERVAARLNEAVIVGIRRTPRQDLECAVNELVEVAVRALSPGVNDPFTAISCIDRLGATLGRLAERRLPAPERCDEDGRLRLVARSLTFPDVLDSAFRQIRQYGRDSIAVTIRLLDTLGSIAERAQRDEDRAALRRLAEMVARHAEHAPEEHDRREIAARFERFLAHLEGHAQRGATGL